MRVMSVKPETAQSTPFDASGPKPAGRQGRNTFALMAACFALYAPHVHATPQLGSVITGAATPVTAGNVTTVNQTAQKSIIHWNSLNTSPAETVRFNLPTASSISLNRVTSGVPTDFQGKLESRVQGRIREGQVWIINQAGVAFANGARVDVGGLLVSTADIADANFLNPAAGSGYFFHQPGLETATITVRNASITAKDAKDNALASNRGHITLLAPQIDIGDGARLKTNVGHIALGAGAKQYEVMLSTGGDLISFAISDPVTASSLASAIGVSGNSLLDVSGPDWNVRRGAITLTASDMNGVFDTLINLDDSKLNASTNGGNIIINASGHSRDTLIDIERSALQATGKGATGGNIVLVAVNNDAESDHPERLIDITGQSRLHVNAETLAGNIQLVAQGYSDAEAIRIHGQNQLHAIGQQKGGYILITANGYANASGVPLLRISDRNSIQTYDANKNGRAVQLTARRDESDDGVYNGDYSDADVASDQTNTIYPCPQVNGADCGGGSSF